MKKLGKLNLMKEKMLSHEELVSFRGGSGDDDCLGYGTNKCSADCPCTAPDDWCKSGKCQTRS